MITEYKLYSDERKEKHDGIQYLTIGGVVCTNNGRHRLLSRFKNLRRRYGLDGEIGWKNISNYYLDAYKASVDVFFDDRHARYSLLSVNRTSPDWRAFREKLRKTPNHDGLLTSIYYQFLLTTFGPLRDTKRWEVFPDAGYFSRDKVLDRVEFLFNRTYKKAFGPKSTRTIRLARALDSKDNDLVQLADLLLGCSACSPYACTPESRPREALLMHFRARRDQTRTTQRSLPKLSTHHWVPPDRFFS